MHCVIGSGPAGVACAKALLARGMQVLMLDTGIELEPDRARTVRELATVKPSEWPPESVSQLKQGMTIGASGIPLKLGFGSDFPYRDTRNQIPWDGPDVELHPSLAFGGLSNTQGAAVLPFCDSDITDWLGGMFGRLVAQVRQSSLIPLVGDGSRVQFLVHNEDLCAFIEKFASGKMDTAPRLLTVAHENRGRSSSCFGKSRAVWTKR